MSTDTDTRTPELEDLLHHIVAHAESVGLPAAEYRPLLERIRTDGVGPGSWVYEWSTAAEEQEAEGDLLAAAQRYAFARFPFVDGNARLDALEHSVRVVGEWAAASADPVVRLELPLPGATVPVWAGGLDARRPLLVIAGGIVSTKEQWASLIPLGTALGYATVVTELPGVGETPLPYSAESVGFLPALLDALVGRADTDHTVALALSFSGHLALAAAPDEPRLRAVVTAAAPVHGVFADAEWQRRLPVTTVRTLAHLSGGVERPAALALTPDRLAAIDVPVHYVAAGRDEVIAPGDLDLLRAHVRDLRVLEHDDTHGTPQHAAQTRVFLVAALREHVSRS
jgi:hypothetical protein